MEELFDKLLNVFSLEYMISVIIATFMLLKVVDMFNGKKVVPTWLKRVISCVIGAVLLVIFKKYSDVTTECLIASFFAAVFVYDVAIKEIMKRLNIDYKK